MTTALQAAFFFTQALIIAVAVFAIYCWMLQARLLKVLRERHPSAYAALSSPLMFRDWKLQRFLWAREDVALHDAAVSEQTTRLRRYIGMLFGTFCAMALLGGIIHVVANHAIRERAEADFTLPTASTDR